MNLLIISSSLTTESRSRMMAQYAYDQLKDASSETIYIDLREYPLPMYESQESYSDPNVKKLSQLVHEAQGILIATPIYNYNVNAALKNLIELSGRYWVDKVVGFMCSAGGKSGYMSIMSLANSLMLDFRSIIIPRFVYANGSGITEEVLDETIKKRIDQLLAELLRFVKGLKTKD